MADLLIRSSKESEARKLAELFAISFGITDINAQRMEQLTKTFRMEIQKQIVHFLVACRNEQIIGLGGETRHDGASYLGYLGVNLGHRRTGIGSTLLKKLLQQSERYNRTIELFSNLGVEDLYYNYGFRGEFKTHVTSISQRKSNYSSQIGAVESCKDIPGWVLDLDKVAVGFDRSRFFSFLIEHQGAELAFIDQKGFCLFNKSITGPVIAKDEKTALSLIEHSLSTGPKRIIVPEHAMKVLNPLSPIILQTCQKMTRGKPLKSSVQNIWAYHGLATS